LPACFQSGIVDVRRVRSVILAKDGIETIARAESCLHVSRRDGPPIAGLVTGVAASTVGAQALEEWVLGVNLSAEGESLNPSRGSREGPEKIVHVSLIGLLRMDGAWWARVVDVRGWWRRSTPPKCEKS